MGGLFYLFIVYVIIIFFSKVTENIKKQSTNSTKKSSGGFFNELSSLMDELAEDDNEKPLLKDKVKMTPKEAISKQQTRNRNSQKQHAKKHSQAKRNANAKRNTQNIAPKPVVKASSQQAATQQKIVFPVSELENPKSLATTSQKNTDATAILCDLFMELQDYLRGVSLESLPISRLDREFIAEFMTISNDGFHYTSRHEFIVLAGRFERIVFKNPGLPDPFVKRIKKITDYVVFLQTGQKNTAKPAKEVMKATSTKAKKPVMKLNKLTQMVVYKEIFDKPVSKR